MQTPRVSNAYHTIYLYKEGHNLTVYNSYHVQLGSKACTPFFDLLSCVPDSDNANGTVNGCRPHMHKTRFNGREAICRGRLDCAFCPFQFQRFFFFFFQHINHMKLLYRDKNHCSHTVAVLFTHCSCTVYTLKKY